MESMDLKLTHCLAEIAIGESRHVRYTVRIATRRNFEC